MNSPRVVVPVALLAAAIATTPAHAKSAKVKTASLSWNQTNIYVPGAQLPVQKTFLGYVANLSKGTVTPLEGAKGTTVTGTSTAGPTSVYTTKFTTKKGKFNAKAKRGTLTFKGIVEFKTPAFTTTLQNPKIVLKGKTGQIISSGTTQTGVLFSNKPLLNLDLSKAKVKKKKKTYTISGIAPSIATTDLTFTSGYPVGAGPERTPNTFGSFALVVKNK